MTDTVQAPQHLLVVDDEPINLALTKAFFFGLPTELTLAASGEAAIQVLDDETRHFDAVLLDLMMPGIDGFQVLQHIRQSRLRASLPVIVQSGNGDLATINRAVSAGANEYLIKPFVLDTLLNTLRRIGTSPR